MTQLHYSEAYLIIADIKHAYLTVSDIKMHDYILANNYVAVATYVDLELENQVFQVK